MRTLTPPSVPPHTDSDNAAFAEHTRTLTIQHFRWLGLALAAAALVWWPVDWWLYADQPETQATLARFRSLIIALDLTLVVVLPRIAIAREHAHSTAIGASALNLAIAGWTLGAVGHGDPVWLAQGYLLPMFAVLLLVPLRVRVPATLAYSVVLAGFWGMHPNSGWEGHRVGTVLSYLVFSTALAIGVGHLVYVLTRRSFHLRRQVERQHASLAELAEHLEHRVAEQTRALRALHASAQSVRAEERASLARDLHDDLGQELTSLRLLVGVGRQVSEDNATINILEELEGQVARLQQSLRRLLVVLQPQDLEKLGLTEALRQLVHELQRLSGLSIHLEVGPLLPLPLPADHETALYRIAHEGLTNAVRHARARTVRVELDGDPLSVRLVVEDDGIGIPPDAIGTGVGTRSILERVAPFRGSATWTGDTGTRLAIELPLESPP